MVLAQGSQGRLGQGHGPHQGIGLRSGKSWEPLSSAWHSLVTALAGRAKSHHGLLGTDILLLAET